MHQLAGSQVLGTNKAGSACGGVEVEVEGGEDVARRRSPERTERFGTGHRAGRGVEGRGSFGLHGKISSRSLGAIGQAGDHRVAAAGGQHIGDAGRGDSGAGAGTAAGLGAAGGAAGAAGEGESGLGAEVEIVASGTGTVFGTKNLDVGFGEGGTIGAGGHEGGRIGSGEAEAGAIASQGGGVSQSLNAAHLSRQIEAIHTAKAEDAGRGIAGHAGGSGGNRIGSAGAQAQDFTGLNSGAIGDSAVEIDTGNRADGIGGGDSRAVGLQVGPVVGRGDIDRIAVWFGTELELTRDRDDVGDVVVAVGLDTAVRGGEANPIAIDQREGSADLGDGEAVGGGSTVVDEGEGAEGFGAYGLGGDAIAAAGRGLKAEIGAGLNAVGAGIGEVGIVDAVGAAGKGSQGQAINGAGGHGLGCGAGDAEAEGIAGGEAGVAAAGGLDGAGGIDNKTKRFRRGVGLDVAGEGEGDGIAGREAAAIGAKGIGGEHRIGPVVDGAGDGIGVLGRRGGARGAAAAADADCIAAFHTTGLDKGRNDVSSR